MYKRSAASLTFVYFDSNSALNTDLLLLPSRMNHPALASGLRWDYNKTLTECFSLSITSKPLRYMRSYLPGQHPLCWPTPPHLGARRTQMPIKLWNQVRDTSHSTIVSSAHIKVCGHKSLQLADANRTLESAAAAARYKAAVLPNSRAKCFVLAPINAPSAKYDRLHVPQTCGSLFSTMTTPPHHS